MRCVVLLVVGAVACYAPNPPAGVPCTPGGAPCPSSQVCAPVGDDFACTGEPGGPDARIDAAIVDAIDAPQRVCSGDGLDCPTNTTVSACGGSCWTSCKDLVTYDDALRRCRVWGGELTTLRTVTDVQCFGTVQDGNAWLGLVQKPDGAAPDANWSWNGDGIVPAFFSWDLDEPNDSDGIEDNTENCAFVQTSGRWKDKDCPTTTGFACVR